MKNWFGMESHPTDEYVFWQLTDNELLALAVKIRAAYDKIIEAGLKTELDILTKAARDEGYESGYESGYEAGYDDYVTG